ncbi:MAG: tRNA (adenosine(37)-N6)-dimethylallyltransferase MiaA [Clostridia bacterium]|nr:tRNA (adenosine(37)-N6)-dimethylallyltransferase MiaA [Clostridia bacterium]
MKKVIVIVGPTASGKTALSVELAKRLNGEIVSSDSMQIYKELNIGTAKPDMEERCGIPHHMMDIVSVRENYSVSRYEEEAAACIEDIFARGKQPIVVGGTGLYTDALIRGTGFLDCDDSGETRARLEQRWENEGPEVILEELRAVDPDSAERLHINDKKRVIRALEVYLLTGKTITAHNLETQQKPPRYESIFIGICPQDRAVLYERIDRRVEIMMEQGLLQEVRDLEARGLMIGTAVQAIGYKELFGYLRGEATLEESVALIQQKSRNYAKRQLTWFNKDTRIHWIRYEKGAQLEELANIATTFLRP